MSDNLTSRQAAHEQLRESLIGASLTMIKEQVVAVIPSGFPTDTRKAILTEILPESRFNLEALSTPHLQSNFAIESYVDKAIATAEFLVQRIMTAKASTITESVCPDCDGSGAWDLWESVQCQCCGGIGTVAVPE